MLLRIEQDREKQRMKEQVAMEYRQRLLSQQRERDLVLQQQERERDQLLLLQQQQRQQLQQQERDLYLQQQATFAARNSAGSMQMSDNAAFGSFNASSMSSAASGFSGLTSNAYGSKALNANSSFGVSASASASLNSSLASSSYTSSPFGSPDISSSPRSSESDHLTFGAPVSSITSMKNNNVSEAWGELSQASAAFAASADQSRLSSVNGSAANKEYTAFSGFDFNPSFLPN
jgi:multidrug efflux pump subunit AcrA (membrane-fusion protein)